MQKLMGYSNKEIKFFFTFDSHNIVDNVSHIDNIHVVSMRRDISKKCSLHYITHGPTIPKRLPK